MTVGILKPFRGTVRPLQVYKQILDHNHIAYVELDINQPSFWEEVSKVDLFLAKIAQTDDDLTLASQIIPVINKFLGIKCFPDYNTVWHYDDKVKQYYLLKSLGFPVIEAFIFWDKQEALKWAGSAKYPVVFKLKGGAGSVNVKLIQSRLKAERLIKKAFGAGIHPYFFDLPGKAKAFNRNPRKIAKYFLKPLYNRLVLKTTGLPNYTRHKNCVYFQKFIPNNLWDTRVTTAGLRAHAFRRFVRKGDFRASGSDNWDISVEHIDKRMVKIALEISKYLGFQSMAYDFVIDENNEPKIVEISYSYGGAGYPDFMNGYWDEDLVWHEGRFWPQYFELVDALQMPDLKIPLIDYASSYRKAKMST